MNEQKKTSMKTSKESHMFWEIFFQKTEFWNKVNVDIKADNVIGDSNVRDETTKVYKQDPVSNDYYILSELNVVLRSGFCRYFFWITFVVKLL